MTCTICGAEIAEQAPAILLDVGIAGHSAKRFTGVVWHPQCSPVDREHLISEASALLARTPVATKGDT